MAHKSQTAVADDNAYQDLTDNYRHPQPLEARQHQGHKESQKRDNE
jgi:hypothetical protein